MIEKITFALIDESGNIIPLRGSRRNARIEINIDVATADLFSEITFINNSISDEEIKIAEKFHLAKTLQNYLEEKKENGI